MPLNPKHQRFAEEYVIDHNGTQAAIRAGYAPRAARQMASELLTIPAIAETIAKLDAEAAKGLAISAERIRKEIARIAFLDPANIVGIENGRLTVKDMSSMPEDARRAIASIGQTQHGIRITFCSKETALRLLADIEGLTTAKEPDADLPPINPEIGHDEPPA